MVSVSAQFVVLVMLVCAARAGPVARSKNNSTAGGNTSTVIPQSLQGNSNTPSSRSINGRTSGQVLISSNEQFEPKERQQFKDVSLSLNLHQPIIRQDPVASRRQTNNNIRVTSSQSFSVANLNCNEHQVNISHRTNCSDDNNSRSRAGFNSNRDVGNNTGITAPLQEIISKDHSRNGHTDTSRHNSEGRSTILGLGVRSAAQDDDHSVHSTSLREQSSRQSHSQEILQNISINHQSINGPLHSNNPVVEIRVVDFQEELTRNNQNTNLSSNKDYINGNNTSLLSAPRKEERKFFHHDEEILLKPNSRNPGQQSYEPLNTNSPEGRIVTPSSYFKAQAETTAGSKIIFPGETDSNSIVRFKPEVDGPRAKCANQQPFCETEDHYPHDYVQKLLENHVNIGPGFQDYIKIDVDIRIKPDDPISLCPSIEQVVYPKVAQNKDDKWLYVVNQDPHVQGVRIEKCGKQDKCAFSENFPSGYITSCQQKYIYRKLLALGEDGSTVTDSFRLPSCCSCVVNKQFPMARMGDITPAPSRKRRR